jgi:hypothetical protein
MAFTIAKGSSKEMGDTQKGLIQSNQICMVLGAVLTPNNATHTIPEFASNLQCLRETKETTVTRPIRCAVCDEDSKIRILNYMASIIRPHAMNCKLARLLTLAGWRK